MTSPNMLTVLIGCSMKKIWLRLGVTIEASDKETKKILNGDGKVLADVIRKNGFIIDGDSYILGMANTDLGLEEDEEIGFDMYEKIEMK